MTRSHYGDRDTIGTMAVDALDHHDRPCAGDLGHELLPSFVEDLNDSIRSNPYNNQPFYISVHEKKDAQLTNTLHRRMVVSMKRPYPEPNTSVFWTNPKSQETLFCWSLPHWSVFQNYIYNPDYYEQEQIDDIKAYLAEDLSHFGFKAVGFTEDKKPIIAPLEKFQDRKLRKKPELTFKI